MELALNLVWLVVCAFALGWWLHQSRVRQIDRHAIIKGLLVLACILVIVFPVISASDDLCAMAAPMEDSFSLVRRVKVPFDGSPRILAIILPLWTLLAVALGSVSLACIGWTERLRLRRASVLLISPRIGRSPPLPIFAAA